MGRTMISIPQLANLYTMGVTYAEKVLKSADVINTKCKFLRESGCFEGKQGEACMDMYIVLSKLGKKISRNATTMSKFLDDKIGRSVLLNNKDHYGDISDKAKGLLNRRLKK